MYKKLPIDFSIPEDLEELIDQYVTFLNTGKGIADDYYRTEIQLCLNWCYREHLLSDDRIKLLRDYYQHKGIKRTANTANTK